MDDNPKLQYRIRRLGASDYEPWQDYEFDKSSVLLAESEAARLQRHDGEYDCVAQDCQAAWLQIRVKPPAAWVKGKRYTRPGYYEITVEAVSDSGDALVRVHPSDSDPQGSYLTGYTAGERARYEEA
jgi:hypothetical protein